MTQRMSATERRAQLLTIMQEMHEKAQSQTDFTAAKIAQACSIAWLGQNFRRCVPSFLDHGVQPTK